MAKKLTIKKSKKYQTIRSRNDPAPMDSSPWFKLFLAAESGAWKIQFFAATLNVPENGAHFIAFFKMDQEKSFFHQKYFK